MHGSNPGFYLTCSQSQIILYITINQLRGNKMTRSDLEIIFETTKTLSEMCTSNHDYCKIICEELQKLIVVIKEQETRIKNLEAK